MSDNNIDQLTIGLEVDDKNLKASIKKVDSNLTEFSNSIKNKLGAALKTAETGLNNNKIKENTQKLEKTFFDFSSKVKSKLLDAVGVLSGGLGLDFARNLATEFANSGSKIAYLSNTLNTNVSTLAVWGEAVKRHGGQAEDLFNSLYNIQNKVQHALKGGDPELLKMLTYLKVNPSVNGQLKDNITLAREFGQALRKLPGSNGRAFQQQFAQEIGMDPATLRLMLEGVDAQDKEISRLKQLGILTDDQSQKSIILQNKLSDLNQQWTYTKFKIGEQLAPAFIDLSNILMNFITNILPILNTDLKKFENVTGLTNKQLIEAAMGITALITLTTGVRLLAGAFTFLAGGVIASVAPLAAVAAGVAGLLYLIDKFVTKGHILKDFKDTLHSLGVKLPDTLSLPSINQNPVQNTPKISSSISNSNALVGLQNLTPYDQGIAQLETSGGNPKQIAKAEAKGAIGAFGIRPRWFKQTLKAEHNPMGNWSESDLAKWLMVPQNNLDASHMMLKNDIESTGGSLEKGTRMYSGNQYGSAQVLSKIPQSASLQPGTSKGNTTNKQVSLNVHNLNLPHVVSGSEFVQSVSEGNITSWAYSGGQLA